MRRTFFVKKINDWISVQLRWSDVLLDCVCLQGLSVGSVSKETYECGILVNEVAFSGGIDLNSEQCACIGGSHFSHMLYSGLLDVGHLLRHCRDVGTFISFAAVGDGCKIG